MALDFPAAAQGFIDGDQGCEGAGLALGQLVFDGQLSALGVQDGQEIHHAAAVTLVGPGDGQGRGMGGGGEVVRRRLQLSHICPYSN